MATTCNHTEKQPQSEISGLSSASRLVSISMDTGSTNIVSFCLLFLLFNFLILCLFLIFCSDPNNWHPSLVRGDYDEKQPVEKYDERDFRLWKMQSEDYLYGKDLFLSVI